MVQRQKTLPNLGRMGYVSILINFKEKWLSGDDISQIYYQNCLDKKCLLTNI